MSGRLDCPRCSRVDQVQSVAAVHMAGKSSSVGVSATLGHISRGGLFEALTLSGTSSSTELSASLEPMPTVSSGTGRKVVAILGLVLTAIYTIWGLAQSGQSQTGYIGDEPVTVNSGVNPGAVLAVAGVLSLCFALLLQSGLRAGRRYRAIQDGTPRVLELWNAAWFCHRCGGVFIPGEHHLMTLPAFRSRIWETGGFHAPERATAVQAPPAPDPAPLAANTALSVGATESQTASLAAPPTWRPSTLAVLATVGVLVVAVTVTTGLIPDDNSDSQFDGTGATNPALTDTAAALPPASQTLPADPTAQPSTPSSSASSSQTTSTPEQADTSANASTSPTVLDEKLWSAAEIPNATADSFLQTALGVLPSELSARALTHPAGTEKTFRQGGSFPELYTAVEDSAGNLRSGSCFEGNESGETPILQSGTLLPSLEGDFGRCVQGVEAMDSDGLGPGPDALNADSWVNGSLDGLSMKEGSSASPNYYSSATFGPKTFGPVTFTVSVSEAGLTLSFKGATAP
ncbi:hypothetical protein Caci_8619 [Catenulispora acidiphila DSM 44928]|uniref:Uncharacterized protein n=2 Tax=Catenulispora TaxID=414878 RepID=C7Q0A4_CATAD|nr:hypothetical protein Caci_8619 [Catenulispora acidiphila DSM 44928]